MSAAGCSTFISRRRLGDADRKSLRDADRNDFSGPIPHFPPLHIDQSVLNHRNQLHFAAAVIQRLVRARLQHSSCMLKLFIADC